MANPHDAQTVQAAMTSARWSSLVRLDTTPAALGTWDKNLIRESRVLVPIDVQALYVPPGDQTKYVRLPFALTTPDGQAAEAMPAPFAGGVVRPHGVYLHWAPPDALLNGNLQDVPDGSSNRLGLPALPDRWVVLRIVVVTGSSQPVVTGWVLETDTAKVIPLANWPTASATTKAEGKTVAPDQLTGTIGGSTSWVGVYDAVHNRLSFFDPLTDIAGIAPNGVFGNAATYLVTGWWSDSKLDPLWGADTTSSFATRLADLNWSITTDEEASDQENQNRTIQSARRDTLGVSTANRYGNLADNLVTRAAVEPLMEQAATPVKAFAPGVSCLISAASQVIAAPPSWPRTTLLNGTVHGVPVTGAVMADQIPAASGVDIAIGHHGDDVASALTAAGLGVTAADERRNLERILSAFTGQLLPELGTPDGAVDADEHEHAAGFSSLPGGQGAIERLRIGAESGPLTIGRSGRSQAARVANAAQMALSVSLTKLALQKKDLVAGSMQAQRKALQVATDPPTPTQPTVEVREVQVPAPRYYVPLDPLIAVRGAKRNLRYRGDGRFSPNGVLQCLWPSQVAVTAQGTLNGSDYISTLNNGAIPEETLILAQNALIQDPYFVPWLAQAEAARRSLPQAALLSRLSAEAAIRFGANGVYDGATSAFLSAPPAGAAAAAAPPAVSFQVRTQVADQLRRFSLVSGVDVDPVGLTVWSQPWIPLWLEWEVAVQASDRLTNWTLGQVDLDSTNPANAATSTKFQGRSPLHTGTATTLAAAIHAWLTTEEQLDANNQGETDAATEAALRQIADGIGNLDVLTAMLDGFSARFLGLPVDAFGVVRPRNPDGSVAPPVPVNVPQLLLAGVLQLTRARIVDSFGRTLDLAVNALHTPEREQVTEPSGMALRPRLLRPARWLFRFVDPTLPAITPGPGGASASPAEATVDEIDPSKMVNPVAGFLLPDHMDDSLEAFDTSGQPLGQLMHEPFGGGVMWEIAPLRAGPADAGPGYGLAPAQQIVGLMAAGMIAADAQQRQGESAPLEAESALSAFLRVVDTTLWTVDTFSQFGNEHIAGLVGRPIAIVRATLRLDIKDDLDELQFTNPDQKAARAKAYASLADRAFPVRLGEITRSDDGLFGYFVNDDYSEFHVVDKAIRDSAFDVGPGKSQLGQLGSTDQTPPRTPINHPYIAADAELLMHPGESVNLTLLMHPASSVYLTSGVLPRKSLQLVRDWVAPGLAVISPSVRVGPVLVDPDKISLPKVSSFPKDQVWIRRDTPNSWKTDPILAATQTAFFPTMPSDIQEGYIRIAPTAPGSQP
jgi:hypothetical protein